MEPVEPEREQAFMAINGYLRNGFRLLVELNRRFPVPQDFHYGGWPLKCTKPYSALHQRLKPAWLYGGHHLAITSYGKVE